MNKSEEEEEKSKKKKKKKQLKLEWVEENILYSIIYIINQLEAHWIEAVYKFYTINK